MKLKNIISICVLITCVILTASCTEDSLFKNNVVDSGTPVTAKLTFTVPGSSKITVSRAGDSHSVVNSLDIFIYDQATGAFESATTATFSGSNGKYTATFEATTGNKTLLGIANGNESSEWATDMEALRTKGCSLDEMKKEVIKLQQNVIDAQQLPRFVGTSMLLIGEQTVEITKNGIVGDDLVLYRAAVEVTFNIKNGSADNLIMDFNPSTYQVFNVPKGTRIGSNITATDQDEVYTPAAVVVPSKNNDMYSFTFYMPENIQALGTNTGYEERDKWTNGNPDAATLPENKKWQYAPQNSTFIVISGAFNATTEGGILEKTGSVSYTIHLGDFSDSGSMNNYTVERNYSYTYNVTVNGVENIIIEAETDPSTENQPGAEGGVINVENYTQDYTLDAHYEQVFLEYNITDMAASLRGLSGDELKKAIGNKLLMIIETPYTETGTAYLAPYLSTVVDDKDKEEVVAEMDYKWIEFLSQTENARLSEYPGQNNSNLMDGYDVSVALGKAIEKLLDTTDPLENGDVIDGITIVSSNRELVARFTAFVDEYYYKTNLITKQPAEWDEFVNTKQRRMMLAMDVEMSDDHNSQSIKLYSNISQRSMQTFYDLKKASTLNGFGIEAFNETPVTTTYGNPEVDATSMGNGYYNTLQMIGGTGSEDNPASYSISDRNWDNYVNWAQNGYFESNTSTDPVSSHKIENSQPDGIQAFRACMSRNRDLNGNGAIDIDELRWYMPAVHEYIRIALGSGAIASESQLYHGQKSDLKDAGYPGAYANQASIYYTSTKGARSYWTAERGSYSNEEGYSSAVRCIRHLPNPDGSVVTTPDPFYKLKQLPANDGGNYLLDYTGILQADLLRQAPMQGSYGVHNEDDVTNRFYKGMVLSKDYVRTNRWANSGEIQGFTFNEVITPTTTDVCSTYFEKENATDRGHWRVPNQAELTSLTSRTEKFFPNLKTQTLNYQGANYPLDGQPNNAWGILARTKFSAEECRGGFSFRFGLLCCPQPQYLDTYFGAVRCVRDATDEEMKTATTANN